MENKLTNQYYTLTQLWIVFLRSVNLIILAVEYEWNTFVALLVYNTSKLQISQLQHY